MLDAYIYDGLRSPFGRHGGALATVRPDNMIAAVIKALVEKHQLPSDIFDEVLIGNNNRSNRQSSMCVRAIYCH
jgi:acetyl-CoA C-acetyltransferase